MDTAPHQPTKKRPKQRPYLVARGRGCILCKPHDWKAFREPEERDLMSPCTRLPIYSVVAANKQEAVAMVRSHTASHEADEIRTMLHSLTDPARSIYLHRIARPFPVTQLTAPTER